MPSPNSTDPPDQKFFRGKNAKFVYAFFFPVFLHLMWAKGLDEIDFYGCDGRARRRAAATMRRPAWD